MDNQVCFDFKEILNNSIPVSYSVPFKTCLKNCLIQSEILYNSASLISAPENRLQPWKCNPVRKLPDCYLTFSTSVLRLKFISQLARNFRIQAFLISYKEQFSITHRPSPSYTWHSSGGILARTSGTLIFLVDHRLLAWFLLKFFSYPYSGTV